MVECEASMFPLVNLTKVSTAAHSNSRYLLASSEAGLISNPAPANSTSTVGGGDSPSYSEFFHCLAVFDD